MPKQKLRVLIIDDSMSDVAHASALLKKEGHEILSAANGLDGVRMAKSELPDLILMDVVMPELNGFQATRQLSKDATTCGIPIIVVSGKSQETDKVWALRQGAKAYLTKTIDRGSLNTAIDRVMA